MKKFFILSLILILTIFNFKSINATENNLPDINKQSLDTTIKGNDHLYPILIDELYGFIDINGKLVIEPKFSLFTELKDGYYLGYTRNEKLTQNKIVDLSYVSGAYLILPKSKIVKISDKYVNMLTLSNKNYGVIYNDDTGHQIYDFESMSIIYNSEPSHFIIDTFENRCVIMDLNENLYYLNDYNKQKLTLGYKNYIGYKDNVFFFQNDNTIYWVDENGDSFFEYENCKEVFPFINGVAAIIDKDKNLKFIDKNKNILNTYSNVDEIIKKDNVYIVYVDEKLFIVDLNGNKKQPNNSESEIIFSKYYKNSIVSYNKKAGTFDIYDENGNIKNSYNIPDGYYNPELVKNYISLQGRAGTGLCEFVNGKINWILEPEYYLIFAEGEYIEVTRGVIFTEKGLFDLSTRKFIIEPKYEFINVYDKNMIYVRGYGYEGYMNSKGELVYNGGRF